MLNRTIASLIKEYLEESVANGFDISNMNGTELLHDFTVYLQVAMETNDTDAAIETALIEGQMALDAEA
jgi:hypothetical protein